MKEMFSLFLKGGPIMWPLLVVSLAAVATALERLWFLVRHLDSAQPELVQEILLHVQQGSLDKAVERGSSSPDPVVKTLVYGLTHRARSLSGALVRAASTELEAFTRGIGTLDTIVTLAPLLGLLGTVTGMVRAFGLLGAEELSAPTAITGGIAEALIATAFGLTIAIFSLVPLNLVNSYCAKTKRRIEQAATELEFLMIPAGRDRLPNESSLRIPSASTAN